MGVPIMVGKREKKRRERVLSAKKLAEQYRSEVSGPSSAPVTGRWKKLADKARLALARAAEKPARSTKSDWRMGRSPSSKG